jgi:CO/xanthine dehydrogenase Mo-binding subunit
VEDRLFSPVGVSCSRIEGWEKVSGTARFTDDIAVPGAWFGDVVRSPVCRGRLREIRFDPAFDWSRVAVVTARTLPGPNVVHMIRDDHPIVAAEEIRFFGEPVALLAAPDRAILAAAMAAVHLDVEELPALLSLDEAQERLALSREHVLASYAFSGGDTASAFEEADLVVEGVYRTGHQEHMYLEPQGMIAFPGESGGVEVTGSLQCPYYVHGALTKALALPPERVVVRQAVTGGAFGGKEDYPSVLAVQAALLALASGKPVRMILDRRTDIGVTTKRHPSLIFHRTGVRKDGTLLGAEIDIYLDGGAYVTLSPVVLSRCMLHACGAYRIPAATVRGWALGTNTPPNGAFRGFGAPQSLFAMERQMDRIAAELGISPLEIRRKNVLRTKDTLPFGQVLEEEAGASLVLEKAVALSDYEALKAAPKSCRDERGRRVWRGVGLSLFLHGGGFTGSGEERIAGRVRLTADEEANVEIFVSSTEMGQGASTVLCQIVAQALALPLGKVRHVPPETGLVPDSGPTVASRTVFVVGRVLLDACRTMLRRLEAAAKEWFDTAGREVYSKDGYFFAGEERFGDMATLLSRYVRESGGPLVSEATYTPPEGFSWNEEAFSGDAYKAYSWGADVACVDVDATTLEIRPRKVTTVLEIGRAVNPVLAAGQAEGGTLQALGYAYLEDMGYGGGRFRNDRMATCLIPTAVDAPEFSVRFEELPTRHGPFGAKGLGELPMDGGAPALLAALEDALGVFCDEIPLSPAKLLERLAAREKRNCAKESEGDGA